MLRLDSDSILFSEFHLCGSDDLLTHLDAQGDVWVSVAWTVFRPIRRYRGPYGTSVETECPLIFHIGNGRDIVAHNGNIGVWSVSSKAWRPSQIAFSSSTLMCRSSMATDHLPEVVISTMFAPQPTALESVKRNASISGVPNGIPLWRFVRILHQRMDSWVP